MARRATLPDVTARDILGSDAGVEQVNRPAVAYCGFTDMENVGDYALYQANCQLFPRLALFQGRQERPSRVNLFGGGTGYPYCLRYGTYPRRRINVAIGLGVEDPEFSGRFGPVTRFVMHWRRFAVFGVRGFRSQQILAAHGVASTVTGDTALALDARPRGERRDAVAVALVGEPMRRTGDPEHIRRELLAYCSRLLSEGLHVVLVPFCRADLPASQSLQHQLGDRAGLVDFWAPPIDENLDLFLEELARMRFVVAERLHAAVLAAAVRVPFVALPYKPKVMDFVGSLQMTEELSMPYEHLSADGLLRVTRAVLAPGSALAETLESRVCAYRQRLRETAEEIEAIAIGNR